MTSRFVVLSLHEGHMASAAIMVDGEVIAATHEERFSRIKNDVGFPLQAARYCLETAGIQPEQVNKVALVGENFSSYSVANILFKRYALFNRADWLKELREYWHPKLMERRTDLPPYFDIMGGWGRVPADHHYDLSRLDMGAADEAISARFNEMRLDAIEQHLSISRDKVVFAPHWLCHHYHAYYSGPLRGDDVVIVHAEGDGGRYNQCVTIPTPEGIKLVSGTNQFNLGRLYQWMTLLLGMKPHGHEYKMMGLAPHASEYETNKAYAVFERYFRTNPDELVIEFDERPADLYFTFRHELETHRFDGIAGGVQQVLETRLEEWIEAVVARTGRRKVAYGGGVAMNVKANMKLAALESVDDFFVPLSPADESNVFGAGYWATERHLLEEGHTPHQTIPVLRHAYLGPAHGREAVRRALEAADLTGFHVHWEPDADQVAGLLASGAVVARSIGHGEFGQRALGNRSILANPSMPGTVAKINHQIKNRDFWMPFAPSVMADYAAEYLDNPRDLASPFMTIGFPTRAPGNHKIMQALHAADMSARPQILERAANPEYYDLIDAFRRKTGIAVLLNTSFNLHGEPIVNTPEDALHVFFESALDALWMDGALLTRRPIGEWLS